MKSFYSFIFILSFTLLIGCQKKEKAFSDDQKEAIRKELNEQFALYIDALNKMEVDKWAAYFSKNEFISAIVGSDFYNTSTAYTDSISRYMSLRTSQNVEPTNVNISVLAPDLALLASEENAEMELKTGGNYKSKHSYTMLWKKEAAGWKIVHVHESWKGM